MPYIPQEILDKIIGYATADDPLADVTYNRKFSTYASFVSYSFHQIILPYKFRSLTFRLHDIDYNTEKKTFFRTEHIPKLYKAIKAGDAHALSLTPLVQNLNILGNPEVPEPLEIIINSFRNLTCLRMEKCVTSFAIMEQLGKLVHLQSLHTADCQHEEHYYDSSDKVPYGALSNLQSLHTLQCEKNWINFRRHLACIPMKSLRILKSSDPEVVKSLLTSDPPVQLEELWIFPYCFIKLKDHPLLWNYLARVTSLTHLSIPLATLELLEDLPPLIFPSQELQYLHIHVALAPLFANQPLKKLKIDTKSESGQLMVEVRQHWQGIVFPHVKCLATDRPYDELNKIPIEFWREFLLNFNQVSGHVFFLDSFPSESMLITLYSRYY